MFSHGKFVEGCYAFISFSFATSGVYVLNDIFDAEKDLHHPKKNFLPISSKQISIPAAWGLCVMTVVSGFVICSCFSRTSATLIYLVVYLVLNILYSVKLKHYPIGDIAILASGFVIRVYYGGAFSDIAVSDWLFLCILAGALFMGIGKRRNELRSYSSGKTRYVLRFYNENFLSHSIYLAASLCIVFYALWCTTVKNSGMIFTVPVALLLLLSYCLAIEDEKSSGDPVTELLGNRTLLFLGGVYVIMVFCLYYGKKIYECF
jgi:4-hydroxybenzoate polyprenyltransferase